MSGEKEYYQRPSWDEYFMEIAKTVAKRATCDRGRSGAVLVKDRQILTTGYVGSPPGMLHCDDVGHQFKKITHEDGTNTTHCIRTTHAEENAIAQAAKRGISINGTTLYCKMVPCYNCAKLLVTSGVVRIVAEKDYHASKDSKNLFKETGVELNVLGGLEEYVKM